MFTNDKRMNFTGAYWEMTKEISGSRWKHDKIR